MPSARLDALGRNSRKASPELVIESGDRITLLVGWGGRNDKSVQADQESASLFGRMYGYGLFWTGFECKSTGSEDLG